MGQKKSGRPPKKKKKKEKEKRQREKRASRIRGKKW
jgi:hypothetical protein